MIGRFLSNFKRKLWEKAIEREIDRALAQHRIARSARSEAARRGHSTHWRRAAANCRAMFPEIAR